MAAAILLCHAGIASALGFGVIRVHSALNEPLEATINLVALTPDEKAALDVHVASVDMFERFGIERTALADRLRVTTSDGGAADQVRVRLTTASAVREPFLRFLIEADTGAGRALREYTVLLDPPGQTPAASAQPAVAASATAPRDTIEERSAPAPATTAPSANTSVSRGVSDPSVDEYGPVSAGETLSRIADRVRRPGATLDQMQVAIYRNNPQAFSDNMNVLLRGAMLEIPPIERIRAIEPATARAVIAEQSEQAAARIVAEEQAAASTTLANAEAPPTTTDARLRLEPPRAVGDRVGGGAVGTAGFGRLLMPDFASNAEQTASTASDADSAVATGDLAGPNASFESSEPAELSEASAPEDATTTADEPSAAAQTAGAADSMVSDGNTAATDRVASDTAQNTGIDPEATVPDAAPETPAAQETTDARTSAPAAPVVDDSEAYQPLPSENQDVAYTGGSEGLLQPRNLLLLVAGLLLLIALLIWNRRRQYKPVPLNFDATDDSETRAGTVKDEREAQVYTYATPTETVPGDDALAPSLRVQQADRQMKMGLFDEARAGLEEGLTAYPDDRALQDKRLELDYVAGDGDAFSANVERFGSQLSTDGVRWAGVATMGRVLLPDDPRFGFSERRDEAAPIEAPGSRMPPRESAESILERFESGAEDDASDPLAQVANDGRDDRYFSLDDAESSGQEIDASDTLDGLDIPVDTLDDERPAIRDTSAEDLGGDGGFEWQDQQVDTSGSREHDRGDDPGMTFDLDAPSPDTASGQDKPAHIEPIDTSDFDLGDDEVPAGDDAADPVEIRLDLARMYIEMEDHTAARELLEEAVNDGSEAQRTTAQQLLSGL